VRIIYKTLVAVKLLSGYNCGLLKIFENTYYPLPQPLSRLRERGAKAEDKISIVLIVLIAPLSHLWERGWGRGPNHEKRNI
jgi:hypothetical protein